MSIALVAGLMVVAGCDGGSGQQVVDCEPGTTGTECEACAVGTYCAGGEAPAEECLPDGYDDDADPATACIAVTQCTASEYESAAPTATTDRVCTALTVCAPGTAESVAPTPTSDRECEACAVGTYCAGGEAPAEQCLPDGYDDDADPATACIAVTQCTASEYESAAPTATTDRVCTALTVCAPGTAESVAPTPTSDRTCAMCVSWQYCAGGDALAEKCSLQHNDPTAPCATAVQVAAGAYHTCAVDSAGGLTCWGNDNRGQATIPGGLGNVVQVAAGYDHTCAIDTAGGLTCWGWDNYGQVTVPGGLGEVVQVAVGIAHTCAVNSAGGLTCWGQDEYGQATVPGGLSNVVQIEAKARRTCAVDSAGGLACWVTHRGRC